MILSDGSTIVASQSSMRSLETVLAMMTSFTSPFEVEEEEEEARYLETRKV